MEKQEPKPINYPVEVAAVICQRIAEGESLRKICSEKGMPSKGAFLGWVLSDGPLADQYARARDIQVDGFVDECKEIADDAAKRPTKGKVQAAKLRIDERHWQAGKQKPKKWGDVDRKEISGPAGAP